MNEIFSKITLSFFKYRVLEVAEALGVLHCTQAPIYVFPDVRPPTGLFYIERDPHSRTGIGERDIVLSAQE
jgi:hypothetical protein